MSHMLSTEQILNAKFTPVSKGTYSAEEVDAFIKTVAASYENSLNNNQELLKKISILADKIESYRNDEEAIKSALLDAHKMAESVNKSAKEKAENIVSESENRSKIILDGANRQSAQMIDDAKEKAKEIVNNARTAVASLTERAQVETDNAIAAAKKKAAEIVAEAERKGSEIIGSSKQSYEFYSAEIERMQAETSKFKSAIEEICKGQLNLLDDIPNSFAAVISAAAASIPTSTPAEEKDVCEEPVSKEAVELEKTVSQEAVEEKFEEIIEEIDEPDSSSVNEQSDNDESEEEHDASALALMEEINGLAADVMNVVDDTEEEAPVVYDSEPVIQEDDTDEDDLFSLIEDVELEDVPEPDSLPSSLDDLILNVDFDSDSEATDTLELENTQDDDDEFEGFQVDLDSIDSDEDDEDITSLFDTLFDE